MKKIELMLYLISFLLGGAGAWIIVKWGIKLSLLDKPNLRSSHKIVTPKGGGIGILTAFFICSITLSIPKSFWISTLFLSVFSFWGDRSEITPKIRLLLQFSATIILLIGILMEKQSGVASYVLMPLFAIFIVGTANFYNFMDGINGIAGITGIVGFGLTAFYVSNFGNHSHLSILSVCMSISCAGFLPFNIPKARVFMGDVGSILLGFVFSAMVIYLSNDMLDFICISSFLFPFYADELTTMIVRIKDGENLIQPHRRHLYQLLANEYSVTHWKISLGYGIFQLIVGTSVLLIKVKGSMAILSALIIYFCSFTILSFIFRKKVKCQI
jgi:Fuc2NAc and GlcNAc transferase